MDQRPAPPPSSPTRPPDIGPWDEKELVELKKALIACDGEATLTILTNYGFVDSEKWRKLFGSYISGLLHLRHSGFNSMFTAVFHQGEWTFRLRERKPEEHASPTAIFSSLAERGVDQLKSVLIELGGSAPLDIIREKYKERYVLTFQESCLQYFHVSDVISLRNHPDFHSSFSIVFTKKGPCIGLKGTDYAPPEAPERLAEKAVEQLKTILIERGGSASLRELDEEYMKRFGHIFAWTCQTNFQQRLADVRSNKVFSSAISTEIQSNEWIFRIKSDKSASETGLAKKDEQGLHVASEWAFTADPIAVFGEEKNEETVTLTVRVAPQNNKKKASTKQNEKKNTPQKQKISSKISSQLAQEGVERLKTVLTSLGGSANLTVLEAEYKKRFRRTFSATWKMSFQTKCLTDVRNHPAFISSFACYRRSFVWIFGLKPGGGTTMTTPTTPSELVQEGVEQLKSLLVSLGGSATLKKLDNEYKKRYYSQFSMVWLKYFQKNSLADLCCHPAFVSTFTCSQRKDDWIFGLRADPLKKVKTPKKMKAPKTPPAELAKEGAELLRSLLQSFGGTATLTQLNKENKKRSGCRLNWKKYFQKERLEDLRIHPDFIDKFTCRWDGTNWIFCIKPSKPQPMKPVRTDPPKTWGPVPIPTVPITIRIPKVPVPATQKTSSASQPPRRPSRKEMETRGVDQLKKALAACGGSATTEEWLKKFEEIFGVAPVGSWVDEHFGADRPSGLVDLPVFQKTFIEFETEPGVWAYVERSCPSDEEDELFSGEFEKEEEPSQFLPLLVKPVKTEKQRLKGKAIKKAEKAVSQLAELLETCGGTAELDDLQDMYEERFGGHLDEEWLMEHFGCSNLTELSELPIIRSELILERNELDTWRCSLLNGKVTRRPGTVAAEGERLVEYDGSVAEKTIVAQFVRMLVDVGGIASFGALKDALEKWQRLKVTVTRGQLRRMEDFDKEIELLRNEYGRRLCLRRQEHWNEVKERFLTVLDYCNGHCTTARFAHAYLRHFGVDLEMKNIPEIVSRLPSRLITISEGREADDGEIVSVLNGRGKPMHAGRRKIFQVLKKAGGRATVEEIMDSHEMTHQTDVATVCKIYFGTDVVEELLPMLCNHKMFVLETERGKELFSKPECRGFFREIAIAAFGSASFPPKITDEDLFSHQCAYVADRIEATLQRLGGDARTRQESSEAIDNHKHFNAAFANFVLDCPPLLFQYMIRSKAFMKGEFIFLNSERATDPEEKKKKAERENGNGSDQ